MTATLSTHRSFRPAWPALVALGLALCVAPLPRAHAQSGATAPQALPYTVERVHRDANGRIVPDLRPPPETESYESVPTPGPRSAPPVRMGPSQSRTFEPEEMSLAELAHQRQAEVARIIDEERIAKQRGARVNAQGLTPREQYLIVELRRTDSEVRAHELAHYYTGRPYTAVPEYWFVIGPLGNRYAIAGHVQFDFSPVPGDAAATVRKFETLRRAALAPARPSTFDLHIATELDHSIAELRSEIGHNRVSSRTPRR